MKSKLKVASLSFLCGAICLCLVPGLWAQSAKAPASAAGNNDPLTLMSANTGCGYSPGEVPTAPVRPQHRSGQPESRSGQPSLVLISGHNDQNFFGESNGDAIVGLWQVAFVAKGNASPPGPPDGAPIDAGYATWHSDGTELMNSGRPPASGNFCMGVWQQIGRSTYKLNHWALAWTPDGSTFVGPVNIREVVTVDRSGNNYQGSFTLTQYEPDGIKIVAPTPIIGTVTGKRITPN
jgi:hypothetical protein